MVLSFSHPILLGGWRTRLLSNYAICLQKFLKQMRHALTPIVRVKDFDIGRKLGLNMSMKELEIRKYFIFRMQEINPHKTTIVVNKSDKVLVISMISNRCHTPHITMYHIKRLDYSWCVSGKWQSQQELKSIWTTLRDGDSLFPSKPEFSKSWSTLEFGCPRCLCHAR